MTVNLDFFGPDSRLHHIGLAVRSIEEAVPGVAAVEDPIQRVSVGFVRFSGLPIELIEPAGDRSPIEESLKKGTRLVHICLEVPSLEVALEHCARHGFRKISTAAPAVAFDMRRIVWVFSGIFGLVELVEMQDA